MDWWLFFFISFNATGLSHARGSLSSLMMMPFGHNNHQFTYCCCCCFRKCWPLYCMMTDWWSTNIHSLISMSWSIKFDLNHFAYVCFFLIVAVYSNALICIAFLYLFPFPFLLNFFLHSSLMINVAANKKKYCWPNRKFFTAIF